MHEKKMQDKKMQSEWFWNHPENGIWSGKVRTVVKLSGNQEIIWKDLDSCDTVRKLGKNPEIWIVLKPLERSGWFFNRLENRKWSGKIRTVYQVFLLYAQKISGRTKLIPGNNVTLLPRFLGLCILPVGRITSLFVSKLEPFERESPFFSEIFTRPHCGTLSVVNNTG